jgi:hypothetical protein
LDSGIIVRRLLASGMIVRRLLDCGIIVRRLLDCGIIVRRLLASGIIVRRLCNGGLYFNNLYPAIKKVLQINSFLIFKLQEKNSFCSFLFNTLTILDKTSRNHNTSCRSDKNF